MDAALRPARTQDMAACAAIFNAWVDETDWLPRLQTRDAVVKNHTSMIASDQKVTVVVANNKIVGFMALTDDHFMTALYVDRAYRRKGLGKMLIEHAKRHCRSDVSLNTFQRNMGARKFYEREGFIEVNRTDGDNEEGLPDLLLEWRA